MVCWETAVEPDDVDAGAVEPRGEEEDPVAAFACEAFCGGMDAFVDVLVIRLLYGCTFRFSLLLYKCVCVCFCDLFVSLFDNFQVISFVV